MNKQIANYLKGGYPGLFVISHEEQRVQAELKSVTDSLKYKLYIWSCTNGIVCVNDERPIADTEDPLAALASFEKLPPKSLLVLMDFHLFIDGGPVIIRRVKECMMNGKANSRHIIILGCRLLLPPELEKEITVIEFKLPDKEQLKVVLDAIAQSAGVHLNGNTDGILDAASGLTTTEAENAFALSVVEKGDIDPKVVHREKALTIKKNGLLEIVETEVGRGSVGGLGILMPWLEKRKAAFTPKAREYGLPTPKGFLMVGIPGCGKSLTAKATAGILNVPLLKLDAGRLFGSLVGQSEQNLRSVMQTAEAIAPCVLWIDEIEKGFAGSKSSGQTDGGTSARVFGSFLQWMQEKKAPVFVVATANDITSLPPEFQRKGRFDEMWFVDLPDKEEREEIWKIQITKHGRKIKSFDISELSEATVDWTGSEIEALFVEAMYHAFDEDKEPTTSLMVKLTESVVPLSKTMGPQIDAMRDWAKGKARRASEVKTTIQKNVRRIES